MIVDPADLLSAIRSRCPWRYGLSAISGWLLLCGFCTAQAFHGQDDSILRQIIIFGRHGVRAANVPYEQIQRFARRPYPLFGVPVGFLTPRGAHAEALLGAYFRQYLRAEHLLSGDDFRDAKYVYFRANSIQRSNASARAFAQGLIPGADIPIHSYPIDTPDPVFNPIEAGIATIDKSRAAAEARRLFSSGHALYIAHKSEFRLVRRALFDAGQAGTITVPKGLKDPTLSPIPLAADDEDLVNTGALKDTVLAADPFIMEYADGMALKDVAWGRLSRAELSQQSRLVTAYLDVFVKPTYSNRILSSNAAAHILRSMEQEVYGREVLGAFTGPGTRVLVINSSDVYVLGVANLLRLRWQLDGYQPRFCSPGGSLVFELRQSRRKGNYIVRLFFTAQTLDQLRTLTTLTLARPPASQQLSIPDANEEHKTLGVDFEQFDKLMRSAIDDHDVQDPRVEMPPLTNVPMTGPKTQ